MCCFAGIKKDDVILEPFCGYGAIPVQLAKRFPCKKIYVSDIDEEKVKALQEKKALRQAQGPHTAQGPQTSQGPEVDLRQADAFELTHIQDNSIDAIVTDPPWGLWENIPDIQDFYNKMFASFKRVLKQDGKMIILSARTKELESAATTSGVKINSSLHTLVNGKKATLYYASY